MPDGEAAGWAAGQNAGRLALEDELVTLKRDAKRVRAFFEHPDVRYVAETLSW